jgi:LytS/YehU family sensor histidine kinase
VTLVYVSARRAAERSEALRRVQRERAEAEKRLVDATLAAMQAHVDPAALQATLARIEALVESSPAEADALLRDLVAFLRATIPRSSDVATPAASAPQPVG